MGNDSANGTLDDIQPPLCGFNDNLPDIQFNDNYILCGVIAVGIRMMLSTIFSSQKSSAFLARLV